MAKTTNRYTFKVKRLPIAERPKCIVCQRPLKAVYEFVSETREKAPDGTTRWVRHWIFSGRYGYEGSGKYCCSYHAYVSEQEQEGQP